LLAQSFANRIHQDVAGFLFQFVMVAQAMIEEIALPIDTMFSCNELFPVLDALLPFPVYVGMRCAANAFSKL